MEGLTTYMQGTDSGSCHWHGRSLEHYTRGSDGVSTGEGYGDGCELGDYHCNDDGYGYGCGSITGNCDIHGTSIL
jgi:hypothetical protein